MTSSHTPSLLAFGHFWHFGHIFSFSSLAIIINTNRVAVFCLLLLSLPFAGPTVSIVAAIESTLVERSAEV